MTSFRLRRFAPLDNKSSVALPDSAIDVAVTLLRSSHPDRRFPPSGDVLSAFPDSSGTWDGLSFCGRVRAVGAAVRDISVGQRVAGWAAGARGEPAGFVIDRDCVAAVPHALADDVAVEAGAAAVALRLARLADIRFGDAVMIVGTGVDAGWTARWAALSGATVVRVLSSEASVAPLAGVEDARSVEEARAWITNRTGGRGADAVIVVDSTAAPAWFWMSSSWARRRARWILPTSRDSHPPLMMDQTLIRVDRFDAVPANTSEPRAYARWNASRNLRCALDAMKTPGTELRLPRVGPLQFFWIAPSGAANNRSSALRREINAFSFVTQAEPISWDAAPGANGAYCISVSFEDGSLATLVRGAPGQPTVDRVEFHWDGQSAVIEGGDARTHGSETSALKIKTLWKEANSAAVDEDGAAARCARDIQGRLA